MMKNIFYKAADEELVEIYKDYLGSKQIGMSVASLKPYADQIKEDIRHIELWNCLKLAEQYFFEEVAKRYCELIIEREDEKGEAFFNDVD
jgi:signal transduction histidine kinase